MGNTYEGKLKGLRKYIAFSNGNELRNIPTALGNRNKVARVVTSRLKRKADYGT